MAKKVSTKDKHINIINKNLGLNFKVRRIFKDQIETFYSAVKNYSLPVMQYNFGSNVILKKGTLMYGPILDLADLVTVKNEGFITSDLKSNIHNNNFPWCINCWNISKNISLADYLDKYSGSTMYFEKKKDNIEEVIIPYGELDTTIEKVRNANYIKWSAYQTKEVRYLPTKARNIIEVAFILNTNNDYATKLVMNDVLLKDYNQDVIDAIIPNMIETKYLNNNFRDNNITNRESEILYGLPSCLIEGIIVSRIIEADNAKLKYIKELFPKCYICNIDGKVIL